MPDLTPTPGASAQVLSRPQTILSSPRRAAAPGRNGDTRNVQEVGGVGRPTPQTAVRSPTANVAFVTHAAPGEGEAPQRLQTENLSQAAPHAVRSDIGIVVISSEGAIVTLKRYGRRWAGAIVAAALISVAGGNAAAASAGSANSASSDGLAPFGPSVVSVPYQRIYAFRVASCAALPCSIDLRVAFFGGKHRLARLRDLHPQPIVMSSQPPPGQTFVTWYARDGLRPEGSCHRSTDVRPADAEVTATLTDSAGGSTFASRRITLAPAAPHSDCGDVPRSAAREHLHLRRLQATS